jgi:alpha-1,2-mannosyltransferase
MSDSNAEQRSGRDQWQDKKFPAARLWHPAQRRTKVLGLLLLACFAIYAVIGAVVYYRQPDALFPDFFGLWSFGRFAVTETLAEIYNPGRMQAFQHALDARFNDGSYPYAYPPSMLLLLVPVGWLPYSVARAMWAIGSFAAFVMAVVMRPWRTALLVAAMLAPAVVVTLIYGQTGLLTAGLMLGGLRLAPRRPLMAGVLLGLLCSKPQLALLLPVVIVAARLWRVAAAVAIVVLAQLVVSIILFGAALWPSWIGSLRGYSVLFDSVRQRLDHLMPTVTANLYLLGVSPRWAAIAQVVAAVAAIVVVWRLWRRDAGLLPIAAVPVATFLVTPYAFVYDLPMVAGAVILVLADFVERGRGCELVSLLILALAMLLPLFMLSSTLPLSAPVLAGLLWVIHLRAVPVDND